MIWFISMFHLSYHQCKLIKYPPLLKQEVLYFSKGIESLQAINQIMRLWEQKVHWIGCRISSKGKMQVLFTVKLKFKLSNIHNETSSNNWRMNQWTDYGKYLQDNIPKLFPCNPCTKNCAKKVTMRTRLKPKVSCDTGKNNQFIQTKVLVALLLHY